MSLDVYLRAEKPFKRPESSGIFIRENGRQKEITRAEWDRRNPGVEPTVAKRSPETDVLYTSNITHNLVLMAQEAGIYAPVWHPEDNGINSAADLKVPLTQAIERLNADPDKYKEFNPENGYGSFEALREFLEEYLAACYKYPEAKVEVWR